MKTRTPPRTRTLLAIAIVSAACGTLAACGKAPDASPIEAETMAPWARVAAATGAAELGPDDVLRIAIERTNETWEEDVHADEEPAHTVSAPEHEELVVSASGASARRWDADGLPALRVVRGSGGWQRVGGVVVDLPASAVTPASAETRDWLALLGATAAPPATADLHVVPLEPPREHTYLVRCDGDLDRRVTIDGESALPSLIERMAAGADPASAGAVATLTAQDWRAWDAADGVLAPEQLVRTYQRRSWNTIEHTRVLSVSRASDATDAIPTRPVTTAEPTLGEPERRRVRARDAALILHTGPLTDLPGLHRALARALSVTRANRRGPDVLEFEHFPDADSVAQIKLHCPVDWSREAGAGELPAGIVSRHVEGADVLAFPYHGRYPDDPAVVERAAAKARELGLEPDGAARFTITSDPATAEPGDIDGELLLPVREAD